MTLGPSCFQSKCYGHSSCPCRVPDVIMYFLYFTTFPDSSCPAIAMVPLGLKLYFCLLMWPLLYLGCGVRSASFQVFFLGYVSWCECYLVVFIGGGKLRVLLLSSSQPALAEGFQEFSMSYHKSVLHSFVFSHNIPLYGYITYFYPFISWWTWVVATFGYYE